MIKKHNAMPRRRFLCDAGISVLSLCCTTAGAAEASALESSPARKPNIIVILADDLGYQDTGAYGCKDIPTPHIDSLARNGVRFTDAYITSPVCSPSRAGLLTGRYQQRYGFEFLCDIRVPADCAAKMGLPAAQKTIADRLKALGYVTGALGKWHVGFEAQFLPTQRGFDEFYGHPEQPRYKEPPPVDTLSRPPPPKEGYYGTDDLTDRAVDFIRRHKDEPFFLYLAYQAVHMPLQAPEKYLARFPKKESGRKETQEEKNRRLYAAMTSAMDDGIGRVLQSLQETGREDTLIFFLSDNGGHKFSACNLPLRGKKGDVWEGGIRTPLLVQWKGTLNGGDVFRHPVSSLDILPTAIVAAAGKIDPHCKLDGVDLLPYLSGKNSTGPHETLYWRFGPQWAVRHGDWKLVQGREGKNLAGQSPQIAPVGQMRLFNLAEDIGEATDLAAEYPEKVRELRDLYDQWNAQLADPLWPPYLPSGR